MSRLIVLTIGIVALLSVGACGGGAATGAPAAPSNPPAAATDPPAASESTGAGDAACEPTTDENTIAAVMAAIAFDPTEMRVRVGDVIEWTNNDSVPHTTTLKDDPACTTANLASGATGSLKFNVAGTYPFFCKIHTQMTGTIEVTS